MATRKPPLVYVNGKPLPQPSTYVPNSAALVDGARNARGVMVGALLRDHVSKIELTWNYLYPKQWAEICNVPFISNVKFYNQNKAAWETKKMYRSDLTSQGADHFYDNDEPRGWIGCRVAFIEV